MVKSRPLLQHFDCAMLASALNSSNQLKPVKLFGARSMGNPGQLKQAFNEEEAIQNKLTAFVVIPKDSEKFGPAWLQSFVSAQITEAFAAALKLPFER